MPIILLLRVSFGTFPVPGITEKKNQICVYMCIYIYVYILIPRRLLVRFIEARTIVRSKGTFDTGGKAFHRVIKLATS